MTWETALSDARTALVAKQFVTSANELIRASRDLRRELCPHLAELGSSHLSVVHYTSLEVLYLILQSEIAHAGDASHKPGCLRLYDSVHLRDPTEGWFFLDRIQEAKYMTALVDERNAPCAYMLSLIRINNDHTAEDADHLMHWRAYGDDGNGCSIRFSCPVECLVPVTYGGDAAAAAAGKIDRLLSVARQLDPVFPGHLPTMLRSALQHLLTVRYYYKHKAYQHEREVRVTVLDSNGSGHKPQYDYRRPHIRHYVEHPALTAQKILRSGTIITIGPSVLHQEDAKQSIRQMLRDAGLSGPSVEGSSIPYRIL